ncbi:alanyl-tRNA editing protein Aarsd1 [Culicoides brevitarsis]|uniref:alanyl-tRNA editing protein Aarsd1 n=1 Tax=Culicoides brevitarsis TaxID=469753 RepID=UPI00307C207C
MVFKCQEDSFLREFTTRVKSVQPDEKGVFVVCEDTIIFPEGGGQPCDHGKINNFPVTNVIRKAGDALHFIPLENSSDFTLKEGDEVHQEVNWARRQDHMQQHSGQHLITALFDREFKIPTKSWWLGERTSYVDLDAKDVTQEQISHVERICNELIAAATPVRVDVYQPDDPILQSDELRAPRDLPDDVVGPIRVVTIEGVESNRCCGTHVKHLGQLQAVKLLNLEKTKGKLMLHFLVGNRVLAKLGEAFERECQLNTILNGAPDRHLELATKLQASQKSSTKLLKSLAKELALYEAMLMKQNPEKRYYFVHRHDGIDQEFQNNFLRQVAESCKETVLFITLGDDSNKGSFLLQGPPEVLKDLYDEICKKLDAKGNGKGNRFQGKVNNLKGTKDCDKLIINYFSAKSQ